MANLRVFYACHAVGVGDESAQAITTVQGVQSVSLDTNFNLENIFQLGRLASYDARAQDPTVELTINKALDGFPLVWNLFGGFTSTLLQATGTKKTVKLSIGSDKQDVLNANQPNPPGGLHNATPTVQMTGCTLTSFSYTFASDGLFTEEVTLSASSKSIVAGTIAAPIAVPRGGGVLGRQNMRKHGQGSTFPSQVAGKKISQITISGDSSAESFFELGSYLPFLRQAQTPIDINVAFDVIADNHDGVPVTTVAQQGCGIPLGSQTQEPILIVLCAANGSNTYVFDLRDPAATGSGGVGKARLTSVSYSGGDTGGGNVTITYTYTVANLLKITYTQP